MKLKKKTTCIAKWLTSRVTSPQRSCWSSTIGANSLGFLFWFQIHCWFVRNSNTGRLVGWRKHAKMKKKKDDDAWERKNINGRVNKAEKRRRRVMVGLFEWGNNQKRCGIFVQCSCSTLCVSWLHIITPLYHRLPQVFIITTSYILLCTQGPSTPFSSLLSCQIARLLLHCWVVEYYVIS